MLAKHLGVILEWKRYVLDAARNLARDRGKISTNHICADINSARHALPLDDAGRGDSLHVGDVGKPDLSALGCFGVDQHIANALDVGPNLGHSPNDNIEYLLIFKQPAHRDSRHH